MTKAVDKVDKNKLFDKKLEAIEMWRTSKGHISNLCRAIGISRQTFYNWIEDDQDFAKALYEAEWELHDDVRDALIQKVADGDVGAIKYYLDRRHPDFKPQPTTLIQNNFGAHAKKELEEFGE